MEKAVRHESLFPKEGTVVAATKEALKPQHGGGGGSSSNNNTNKRKRQQQKAKDSKKKPKSEVTYFNYQKEGHYLKDCKNSIAEKKCFKCGKPDMIRRIVQI